MTIRLLLTLCFLTSPLCLAGSKIIATGGASNIEGSAGGGIVPWAVINGYGSSGEWAATAFATQVGVDDFTLRVQGASVSYDNNWEWSFARQTFSLDTIGGELRQDVFGVKYHLAGELLYTAMPQLSLGVQYKKHRDFALPQAVGARDNSGVDLYLAASKVLFDQVAGRNLLLNATLRATKANQTGLLGFGNSNNNDYQLVFEGSAALLLNYNLALGVEFKQKPNELAFANEQHWRDIFAAWFVNKHLSLVAGYADLGSIAGLDQQQGYYLSIEGAW
ncbi:MAG: DUF3034 family protein [Gammaproteobacteria bacterium]|nr:DUF3034 family protein [Gammaproteobacteria bacterium]MBU1554289.1 DUF3034 family protein [Gammaproteobacteria bacterium]MBU2072169.1 DUF3034 family protein [Gammaproteobacteria bacterium]MBU2182031.1 DUF3034 family protein [Gammaproteobacteria bacterium]MBU2203874.1 DUF3034 family protein [Gammaproteobacteria bacterium]